MLDFNRMKVQKESYIVLNERLPANHAWRINKPKKRLNC